MGLNQIKHLLHSKRDNKLKAIYKMRENFLQIIYLIKDLYPKCIRNTYDIMAKIKYPVNKCVNDLNIHFFQRRHTNGPQVSEEAVNITKFQGNAIKTS